MLQETQRQVPLDVVPLSKLMHLFTKRYVSVLYNQLADLPFNRYFYVVVLIGRSQPPLSQNDLGQILEIDKASVARMLDYLSDHKIIERQQNPTDRRQHVLLLTKEGERWLPTIEKAIQQLNTQLADTLDISPRTWLNELINMGDLLSQWPQSTLDKEVEGLLSKSKS